MRTTYKGVAGRPVDPTIAVPAKAGIEFAYLAGIMDGEGYFAAAPRTNAFGLRVAMTDECVIEWLHEHFAGNVSRAGTTSTGKRVYTWTLQRQSDLAYVLPRLRKHLVCKVAQCDAMLAFVRHKLSYPRWDVPMSSVGKAERARRRDVIAAWDSKSAGLREAVALAR